MTAKESKSYLCYLNKLLDQYKNAFDHPFGKKPINADYFSLSEKIGKNPEDPKFNVNNKVRITKYKHIFSKGYTENW